MHGFFFRILSQPLFFESDSRKKVSEGCRVKKRKLFLKKLLQLKLNSVCLLNVLCEFSSGSDKRISRFRKKAVVSRFPFDKVFPLLNATPVKKQTKLLTTGAIAIS